MGNHNLVEQLYFEPSPASFSKIWYAPNHVRAWRTAFYHEIGGHNEMLPILDDFERALQVETPDKTYVKGMELIHQRLFDALKKLGLEPIVAQGEPFDPHVHHAVEMVETEDVPDHTVLAEFQRGYNFKGRLLRPAMVKVAVEPKRD